MGGPAQSRLRSRGWREGSLYVCTSGDGARVSAATPQPRRAAREERPPIDCNRPSDRRSPGMDPGPQGAFEGSMINVSCNSHYFSQLAAFFIDARAE